MPADERSASTLPMVPTTSHGVHRSALTRAGPQVYGTIIIVGGGCYGSYYLRQLRRARVAGALSWRRLIIVDRNARCAVAGDAVDAELVVQPWADFFTEFLDLAAADSDGAGRDAIVPSPLMPHLLFDWVVNRSRARWPGRPVAIEPLPAHPDVPWHRASADGATHYVSFAEWMCPINCIEPARCPATRGERGWTMPSAIATYVDVQRSRGHDLAGPFVFHCTHRAYGVGMIDVSSVISADAAITVLAEHGPVDAIVGTMSHCHGALGRLAIGRSIPQPDAPGQITGRG
jgi:hypothetical protein